MHTALFIHLPLVQTAGSDETQSIAPARGAQKKGTWAVGPGWEGREKPQWGLVKQALNAGCGPGRNIPPGRAGHPPWHPRDVAQQGKCPRSPRRPGWASPAVPTAPPAPEGTSKGEKEVQEGPTGSPQRPDSSGGAGQALGSSPREQGLRRAGGERAALQGKDVSLDGLGSWWEAGWAPGSRPAPSKGR